MQKVKILFILSETLYFQQVVFYWERHPEGKGNDLFSEMGRKIDTQTSWFLRPYRCDTVFKSVLSSWHSEPNPPAWNLYVRFYTSHDSTTRYTHCLNPQFSREPACQAQTRPPLTAFHSSLPFPVYPDGPPPPYLHPRQCQLRCEYCMNECVCLGTIC